MSGVHACGHIAVETHVEAAVVVQAVFAGEGAASSPIILPIGWVVGARDTGRVCNGSAVALAAVEPGCALAHSAFAAGGGGGAEGVFGAYCTAVVRRVEVGVAVAREVAAAVVGDGANCRLVGAGSAYRIDISGAYGSILTRNACGGRTNETRAAAEVVSAGAGEVASRAPVIETGGGGVGTRCTY